jgi:hypothetical protein
VLLASHGVRTIENLRQHLGIDDPEILEVRALILWLYLFLFLIKETKNFRERLSFSRKILSAVHQKMVVQASSYSQESNPLSIWYDIALFILRFKVGNLHPSKLSPYRFLPKPCWAVCTSATRVYASSALVNAAIPLPDVFITSEDVTKGKPHPDPYLLGAEKCGLSPKNCHCPVFEP